MWMMYGDNQTDKNRLHTKLWSAVGHQSDNWITTDINLNIKADNHTFQIEIKVLEIESGHGDVLIDSIVFKKCGKYS